MNHNYRACVYNAGVRPLMESDIECLRIWRNQAENTKYLHKRAKIMPDEQKKWFDDYLHNSSDIFFSIEENKVLKKMVGSAALYNIHDTQAEFGKLLIGEVTAKGAHVGTYAVIAILYLGFTSLSLNKISLCCYKENEIAFRMYNGIGFEVCNETEDSQGFIECKMFLGKRRFFEINGEIIRDSGLLDDIKHSFEEVCDVG